MQRLTEPQQQSSTDALLAGLPSSLNAAPPGLFCQRLAMPPISDGRHYPNGSVSQLHAHHRTHSDHIRYE
ncbi:hypothetical protein HPB50_002826 [Hyalomma asiaticum]|uniref:Uncharacterized protein n=1 Tax=Hyalomma asiaticum TaxID=266040 RepID=A0ACB7SUY6_HYAAI|nr:hypothetical protein HPB50_002826 [Hyalomma asiaticum]